MFVTHNKGQLQKKTDKKCIETTQKSPATRLIIARSTRSPYHSSAQCALNERRNSRALHSVSSCLIHDVYVVFNDPWCVSKYEWGWGGKGVAYSQCKTSTADCTQTNDIFVNAPDECFYYYLDSEDARRRSASRRDANIYTYIWQSSTSPINIINTPK